MTQYNFGDAHINWQTLGDFEHLHYSILDIDEDNCIIDVLFKFAAHRQILLHRHKALNKTFVIQGEHCLYEADGRLKEVRAVGSYTSSLPSDDPHRETELFVLVDSTPKCNPSSQSALFCRIKIPISLVFTLLGAVWLKNIVCD